MRSAIDRQRPRGAATISLGVALVVAACGGGAPATPSPAPAAATVAPTAAPPSVAATSPATGPANLEAPATVAAGARFEIAWAGPNGDRDYVTIVAPTATEWTDEPYFYTTEGSPGKLTAPAVPGKYVLWYVTGAERKILFRRDIEVTPFTGSLLAPESVRAGAQFQVTWNGPDGPGDYVTIVRAGAATWTNESYFYTANGGNPGTLQAPIEAGAYEVWYVLGAAETVEARVAIEVLPVSASVEAPASAGKGASFDVAWTGPDGPGDFITIVAAGAPEAAYLGYCYTSAGSPCSLTAPTEPGPYEVRYVTGANEVIASQPIEIR